jgi:hypothetical protein
LMQRAKLTEKLSMMDDLRVKVIGFVI